MALDGKTMLFVHGIGAIGGAERELTLIVNQLARRGHRPVVVCPCPSPLQRELAACAVETRDAPFPAWRKWNAFLARGKSVQVLESLIASTRPHVIHVNDMWWVPQVLRASRQFPIPVVAHVRQELEPSKVILYELNQVDRVFAVSNHIRRSLQARKITNHQSQTLYSGLDLDRFSLNANGSQIRRTLGCSEDDVVLGTVANLFPRKGYDVMLQAMPSIIAEFPHTHYLIIGKGEDAYERRLRREVKRLRLEGHVHFLGFQSDVSAYVAMLDVYVQPSRIEGLCLAVLEAMAMEKPVVATDVGGLSEGVQHQRTGLLARSDDAQSLAQTVLTLLSDPERRRAFGVRGRRRVEEQFTVARMMDELVSGYENVLRTKSDGSVARR